MFETRRYANIASYNAKNNYFQLQRIFFFITDKEDRLSIFSLLLTILWILVTHLSTSM